MSNLIEEDDPKKSRENLSATTETVEESPQPEPTPAPTPEPTPEPTPTPSPTPEPTPVSKTEVVEDKDPNKMGGFYPGSNYLFGNLNNTLQGLSAPGFVPITSAPILCKTPKTFIDLLSLYTIPALYNSSFDFPI